MKKVLSVLLSMLMIFSTVGVVAFAEDEVESAATVHVIFKDGDNVLYDLKVTPGTRLGEHIENPVKADTETTRYIFKGWVREGDAEETIWYPSTIPNPTADDEGTTITYIAVYSEEDLTQRQTFWNLIESIFERLNRIFEYFAEIFGF